MGILMKERTTKGVRLVFMKLPQSTTSVLVLLTEDVPFVFQEESLKTERDILKTDDHLPTAIPTKLQKYWSRLAAWMNKLDSSSQELFANGFVLKQSILKFSTTVLMFPNLSSCYVPQAINLYIAPYPFYMYMQKLNLWTIIIGKFDVKTMYCLLMYQKTDN